MGGGVEKAGYSRITLLDKATNTKKTYYIPEDKIFSFGGQEVDIKKTKNNEFVIVKTNNKDDSRFNLIQMTLDSMDVNHDGNIDSKDSNPDLAKDLNKKLDKVYSKHAKRNEDKEYYVKSNDIFSDAGVSKGEGGATYRTGFDDNIFEVRIDSK